jgi:FKBP-type peptidyl-prolyl cis-trans isomerase FkpA
VRKLQTRIFSVIAIILAGITMFSMANATTPEENKAAGEAFLAENAKKPNIITTASGLQYEVLKKGEGAKPSATDSVTVHYKGTTIDGSEFDSSYSRGEPATFPLNRVIPGWTEGVQLMQEGAKYRFYIPSELAYGSHGAGRLIGPNSALIFDVELIKIQ